MTKRRARRPASQWAELVSAWRGSGKSQREFAEEQGLSASTLASWSRQLDAGSGGKQKRRKEGRPSDFSKVQVVEASSAGADEPTVMQVTTPAAFVVRVSGQVEPAALVTDRAR